MGQFEQYVLNPELSNNLIKLMLAVVLLKILKDMFSLGPRCAGQGAKAGPVGAARHCPNAEASRCRDLC